jgi:3-phosphoshikimate 1-carboxyvinyltransferase
LFLKGNKDAVAIKHEIEVASAQVKSALLLGAINAHGESEIIEPVLTRDHTEIMMQYLGFNLTEKLLDGKKHIYLNVEQELKAKSINIAGDPSSAAFLASLAILTKGSDIVIKNILFNVHRTGFFEVAKNMGADITIINDKILSGERVVDLRIKYSTLTGVITEKEIAPKTIDEYPILAILAAKAEGKTRFNGLEELKVKESNRFSAIIDNLKNCGVKVEYGNDWIEIEGCKNFKISEVIKTHHDHRIAMSFIILGLTITEQVTIDDTAMIKTSFPEFFDKLKELNANI